MWSVPRSLESDRAAQASRYESHRAVQPGGGGCLCRECTGSLKDPGRLSWTRFVHIILPMRRAASVVLGLLLILGSTLSGPGHVHAAPNHEKASGLHVDHVHLGSNPGARHTAPGPAPEFAADHESGDAVTLNWAGSEATPRRALPCLAASTGAIEPPKTASAGNHDRPRTQPRDPPFSAQPPSRAPPA